MFPEQIETERLRLQRLGPETVDTLVLYEHVNHDAPSPKVTHEFLADSVDVWENREAARFVIRPREVEDGAGEVAGGTELSIDWDRRVGTLGIWLRKRFGGQKEGTIRNGLADDEPADVVRYSIARGEYRDAISASSGDGIPR